MDSTKTRIDLTFTKILRRNYTIELAPAPVNKNIQADERFSSKEDIPKIDTSIINLVFKDSTGKSFSWKVDPGEFLSDKLNTTMKKIQ